MPPVAATDGQAATASLPPRVQRLPIEAARERVQALLADPPEIPPDPLCTCGAPHGEHGGKTHGGRCERTGCQRFRRDVVDALVERAMTAAGQRFGDELRDFEARQRAKRAKRAEGTLGIGPSDTTNCPKKIEYRERPPEGFEPDPEDKRAARIGAMIHRDWVTVSSRLHPWRLHEFHVPIPGLDSKNTRLDRYDPITCVLDDAKTAGDWVWDHVNEDGPDEDVWDQVYVLGLGLIEMGLPVTTVRLIYIKRDNGHDEVFHRPYDPDRAQQALDRLLGYAATLDAGGHLPRSRSGPSTDPICKLCFARSDCWNLKRAEEIGRSGESLTVLGEHFDAAEVEYFAALTYDAKRREREAKAAAKEGTVLLDGIPPGEYGAFEVRAAGRWMPDPKRRIEQLEEHYPEPDGARPPLGELPDPPKRRDEWVEVKPVKAAKRTKGKGGKPPEPEEVLAAAPQPEPGDAAGAA